MREGEEMSERENTEESRDSHSDKEKEREGETRERDGGIGPFLSWEPLELAQGCPSHSCQVDDNL